MLVLSDLARVPLIRLLDAAYPSESEIEAGHNASGLLDLLWDDPEAANWRAETEGVFVPPLRLVTIQDVEIRSDHLPYKDGAVVFVPGVHQNYIKAYYDKGVLGLASEAPSVRTIEAPTFFVTSFVSATYGHFLLEVLPKILLALALRERGIDARIAFPSDIGPVSDIVKSICPQESLLLYESAKERLVLRRSLHPSLLVRGQMHSLFVKLLRQLVASIATPPEPTPVRRLFLSRAKWNTGYRSVANEVELFEIAAERGFSLVHPQDYAWTDQVRLLSGATHIVSAFNSALHGAIFSPPGTKIIALGRVNYLQDCIASSLGHRIGYVHPNKGAVSLYDPVSKPPPQIYQVSASEFRARLDALD
jgi:capsular polysaccharide biosynthesis protein